MDDKIPFYALDLRNISRLVKTKTKIRAQCLMVNTGSLNNPFKPFYDAIIGPTAEFLGPEDYELVIVPNGVLCFTSLAAVIESIRIRTVSCLTSYKLILTVPRGYHKTTGVLLVINSQQWTLTGRRATKAQVMKRMSSFGLIHIAAYGNQLAGENALSLNPGWDYMLKMSDVQGGNIQACLMVLNCFSKWTRQNLGVVGIACAFLAAGARSVLVTL